ncbi:MAG: SusC/RagA family TonB-linked outer membrane protein [Bacteroidales bacterium]|nr:SusC/RagA family TonB-linked outer membrane protein [Bacteroidales bacterium]
MNLRSYLTHGKVKARHLFLMLCALAVFMPLHAQTIVVKGTVSDSSGPTPGATVQQKGANNGTITDVDGAYSIKVPADATLIFSYVGMESQEVAVGGRTNINVTLDDNKELEEVVVVGYGSMRKKDLTGAVTQINPDKLGDTNPPTVQDLLRGAAGLQVGMSTSAKGGGSIQVRGQNSVYNEGGHNSPLLVVDGMIFYGELSEINPDDIGQIDVLKDASSTAIYGARAASGVIIITTKKGKLGKPVINVSANFGLDTKATFRHPYSADGYLKYREDYYKTPTLGFDSNGDYSYYVKGDKKPGYYDNPDNLAQYGVTQDEWAAYTTNEAGESLRSIYGKRLNMYDYSKDAFAGFLAGTTTDWEDMVFRTGFRQDYNASVSGATEKVNYYLSFGWMKNEGVTSGDEYETFRSNIKLSGKVTNWLEISANVNFQDRSDGNIAIDLGTEQDPYSYVTMMRLSPFATAYNEDGSYKQFPMDSQLHYGYNFFADRQYYDLEKGYTILNTIFSAKVKLPFNITYDFNVAPRYQFFYDRYFMSSDLPNCDPKEKGVNRGWAKNFDYTLNNTINWDYTFADRHHVILTLAQEAENHRYWSDNIQSRLVLPSDALGFHNTQNGTKENSNFSTNDTHTTAAAYLARLFYSFDDRYMLTATVRKDGYSAFGASNPWATFPSVSGAWTFTNEEFCDLDWLESGKLRLSWGRNGNRSLADPYLSLANLGAGAGATMDYLNAAGAVATDMKYLMMDRLANPNLKWEATEAVNVGLDFSVLSGRLSGSIDYYNKTTKDMIMKQRLPGFSGFGSIGTNLGEVKNSGLEIALNSVNMENHDFRWTSTLTFSYNKNEIKHLYYDYDEDGKERDDTSNGWFIGKSVDEIWDYEVIGTWQVDEAEEAALCGQVPGDPKVANICTEDDKINADGSRTPVYNDKDKKFLGRRTAPVYWNLRNDFRLWNSFDISFNLYSYMGHHRVSNYYLNKANTADCMSRGMNQYKQSYWLPENPTNDYVRLDAAGPAGASDPSKVYKASFVRLDNISLGYTIPSQWSKKMMVDRIHVTASVRNVAIFGGDKTWEFGDIETGGMANRIYNLGFNFTF